MPALDSSLTMNGQESLQQMNETNFIPLILQAQDLVAKLENRVVELENDLEVINESHEQERDQLLQELGEKDEYVHNLKTKISRLEFGAREAIIVLARTKPDDDNNISRRESVCSEFSVSLDDVDLDGDEDIADYPDPHDPEEIDDTYQTSINYDNIDDEEELEHRRRADFAMSNNKTLINNYGPVPDLSQTANLCPNCNTLLAQVDQHIEERAYLKRDLSALAISLSEEQTLRAQLQVSKESLEQEIDDWINAMFDKVNQMVFDEANTHEELEMLNREFKGKLEASIKSSGTRQDRLRELKLLLVHLDTTKQRQTAPTPTSGLNRNSVIRRSLMSNSPVNSPRSSRIFGNFGHMSPSIFSTASVDEYMQKGRRVYIDGVVFEEFQEYVKSFVTSPVPTNSTPTHAFMKRCMVEDIQPCLFEGSSGWKSPFYKRRLLDAIMKNQCEIQTIYFNSSNSTPMSSQISNTSITRQNSYQEPPPSPKVKCGLCGHLRSCDFRMRLSGPDAVVPPSATTMSSSRTSRFSVTGTPGWIPLDRFCRDRVVAVCDFYTYLSHLRQGLLANSAVWTMYKQCLKHRRKMGMARVGSLSMFEEEEALNNELLNNPEMEGMVVIVH
ncbi:2343_t:CDS:2 [Rhizophagus irregularis]|nr:2343_t:CDS:2 [Rhizophagus irregularis]